MDRVIGMFTNRARVNNNVQGRRAVEHCVGDKISQIVLNSTTLGSPGFAGRVLRGFNDQTVAVNISNHGNRMTASN